MNRKLALVGVAVVLVLGGLWFVLRGEGRAGGRALAPEGLASGSAGTEAETPAEVAESGPRLDEPGASARREEPASAPGALSRAHESFPTGDARWVDVTVLLPGPLPAGDEPALLGFARLAEPIDADDLGRIGASLDLGDAFAQELGSDVAWARRPLERTLRFPFPGAARRGAFLLQSRYLFLEPVEIDLDREGSVTLIPELGAYVTGRCTLPAGAAVAAERIELEIAGREPSGRLLDVRGQDERDVRVRADLGFELRALSAARTYSLRCTAPDLVGHFDLALEFAPGERRELVLPLRLGATLSGWVRDPRGRGIEGAEVSAGVRQRVFRGGGHSATTDADGSFTLRGIAPGKIELEARKEGWRPAEGESLPVEEGQVLGGIELVLGLGNQVRGVVRWEDGVPADEAEVTVHTLQDQRWLQRLGSVRADDQGRFEFGGLEDDPVEIVAQARPEIEELRRMGIEPAVLPGEPGSLEWLTVARGVPPTAGDVVLILRRPLPVPGRVVDDRGQPVRSFQVQAEPADRVSGRGAPVSVRSPFTSADGAFTQYVSFAGEWRFGASSAEGEQTSESVVAEVPFSGAALTLVLPRPGTISGTVLDPSGSPAPGATVASSRPGSPGLELAFAGGQETDASGSFTLENLSSTSVSLVARHPDWAESETLGVELEPGAARSDLVLVLRHGARITGEVFDAEGRPEAGQNVNCGSGAEGMAFGFGGQHSTRTDSAGRFEFEHVTPGRVTVTALPGQEEMLELANSAEDETAFVGLFSDMRSASVDVVDGQEAHVVLGARPKRPVRVHGHVSEAGRPLENRAMFVFAEGGALLAGMKTGRTAEGGRYELLLDRPGDYVFGISAHEGMSGTGTQFYVEVPEVEELEHDFALPLGHVSGRVFGPDGAAAVAVPIRLAASEGMIGVEDMSESNRASTQGDGSFSFEYVHPGTYSLHVGAGLFDGAEARFGGLVVDGIAVREDRATDGIDVHLSAPGKIAGTVRDEAGKPVAGAALFVRDEAGRATTVSNSLSDAAGRFTYSGVAPGRVTVSARSATLACADGEPVEVRSGETSSVELVLATGAFLRVSLLDGDETVRARLRVLDAGGRRVDDLFSLNDFQTIFTEGFSSRGRRVGPLPAGKYTLVAVTLDGRDVRKSVEVEAGQGERHVELRLE